MTKMANSPSSLNLDSLFHKESVFPVSLVFEIAQKSWCEQALSWVSSIFYSEWVAHPSRPCFGLRLVCQGWPLLSQVALSRHLQEPTNEEQVKKGVLRVAQWCIMCPLWSWKDWCEDSVLVMIKINNDFEIYAEQNRIETFQRKLNVNVWEIKGHTH